MFINYNEVKEWDRQLRKKRALKPNAQEKKYVSKEIHIRYIDEILKRL